MREMLRTNDLVRLSWLQALFSDRGIQSFVLDSHTSLLEGSAGAIQRRLMVEDGDFAAAERILRESDALDGGGSTGTDVILGGRLTLLQPYEGYRVAIDPVLLAAAVPDSGEGPVLDIGCGVGAAALCYADRVPAVQVVGLELQPPLAMLTQENARLNVLSDRVSIHDGNLLDPPAALAPDSFAQVMANPPYLPPERANRRSPPADAASTVEGEARLADWIEFALAMLQPKGGITLIHRADRLDEILALLHGRAGGIVVFPLWPGADADGAPRDARRVIVHARKGVATPTRLAGGLVLHEADGSYSAAAERVLRDGGALSL
jgi:tRNA1(Val) A37 N6-methylase TrmN6